MADKEDKGPDGVSESEMPAGERTRLFMEKLKQRYQRAYGAALEVGKEKLQDLRRSSAGLEPRVKQMLGDGLQSAGRTLGQINESLARKAMPPSRRKKQAAEGDASPPSPPEKLSGE